MYLYLDFLVNSSGSTTQEKFQVHLHLGFIKLIDLNEPNEKVDFVIEYIISYSDPRLSWNEDNYDGISVIYPNEDFIYKPDLTPTQSQYFEDFRPNNQKYAMLRSTGVIEIYTTLFISCICNINVRKFPHDSQTCSIRFLSQSLSADVQNVTNSITDPYPFPIDTVGTGEWSVINMKPFIEEVSTSSTIHLQIVRFDITFKRNSIYYYALTVIPSFILNAFSVFGLFIKSSDMMGKLTVGLTNVMSLSFILGIMSEMIPKTKTLPLLAIYVSFNLIIVVVCLLVSAALPCMSFPQLKCSSKGSPKFSKFVNWFDRYAVAMTIGQIFNIINLVYLFFG